MLRIILLSFVLTTCFLSNSLSAQKEKINWMTWEEVHKAIKKEPRKVIVDIYTDWCGWCKRMDATTFSDPDIVHYINQNYYAVKFNAEQKDPINYLGQEFRFVDSGNRGYHSLAAALLQGKLGYPSIVFLDKDLKLIQPIPGYQTPQGLDIILHYFAQDNFRELKWQEFQEKYTKKKKP